MTSGGALSGGGTNYSAGQLAVIKSTDEDGNISYTFTDKQGRLLLVRRMEGNNAHDTYSVYDIYDNLRFVLQPMYQTTADLDRYAFQYRYDGRRRCVWKKMPGAQHVLYEYGDTDRPAFSQDGNQRARGTGIWTYYTYDKFGRLTEQGECTGKDVSSNKTMHIHNYYDNYDFIGTPGFTDIRFTADTLGYGKGSLTGSVITASDGSTKIYVARYYDIRAREIKCVSNNLLGGYDVTSTTYTFTDKPSKVTHTHTASGKSTCREVYTYSYDHADRISKLEHTLGLTKVTLASYTYDNIGRLQSKSLHGSATNKLTYAYNVRSWLTGISCTKFTQNLYYNTGNGTARYNGNISSMTWKAGTESTIRGYKFTYDGLDRILNATYGETAAINTNANRFSENVTGYDKNGNIKSLQRYGQTATSAYGLIDNLTFTLNGNQLTRVDDAVTASAYNNGFEFKDGVKQANEYTYDANGNLTKDLNKNIIDIQYNFLNLPSKVTFSDGSTITYTYAADGTKLRTVHKIGSTTTTTDYCGDVIYENGVQKLLLTEEGYVTLSDSKYHYYLQDHQGNNRVVINQSGTVEETNHYYPFGGIFANTNNVQPYKYNGKELDTKKGLDWYDYGARHYDAAVGRFTTTDPMVEKYYEWPPYVYCINNPLKYVDLKGDSISIAELYAKDKQGNLINSNQVKAFEFLMSTKEGKGLLKNYAAKGQTVAGVTFKENGKFHKEGINLLLGTKVSKQTSSGSTFLTLDEASMNIQVGVGKSSNIDDLLDTFVHEIAIHADQSSIDFIDDRKLNNSNAYPALRRMNEKRNYTQHWQERNVNRAMERIGVPILQQYYRSQGIVKSNTTILKMVYGFFN